MRRQRCETRGRCKAGLACVTIDRHRQSAACVACVPTRRNRREPSGRPLSGGSNALPPGEEGWASGQRPRNAAPQPDTARPVSGGREDRLPSSSLPPSATAQAEIRIPNALACAPASEYGLPPGAPTLQRGKLPSRPPRLLACRYLLYQQRKLCSSLQSLTEHQWTLEPVT